MTGWGRAPEIAILVPVKHLALAKSRLRPLGDALSRALVISMLEDVLDAARGAAVGRLFVLSSDPAYDAIVSRRGATRVDDPAPGYNDVVSAGLRMPHVVATGGALVLPADLPALSPEDVQILAATLAEADVVLAPSDDGGTSALGLRPPEALTPSFGPGSAEAHRSAAEAAGLRVRVCALPNLAIDVDTPADLRRLGGRVGMHTARALAIEARP